MEQRVLGAVDLGNSSGRVMKASYNGRQIHLEQISRFMNPRVLIGNYLKCDVLFLFTEMVKALHELNKADSLGIDSWAIDFALLGRDDDILLIPHHHRDPRTAEYMKQFEKVQWIVLVTCHQPFGSQLKLPPNS